MEAYIILGVKLMHQWIKKINYFNKFFFYYLLFKTYIWLLNIYYITVFGPNVYQ